jgi:hypothetical protein
MNHQQKVELSPNAARIYTAILAILADRKSRSSVMPTELIMRKAKFGLRGVEEAQTELHKLGLLDVELDVWNEEQPKASRFRYSLPNSK